MFSPIKNSLNHEYLRVELAIDQYNDQSCADMKSKQEKCWNAMIKLKTAMHYALRITHPLIIWELKKLFNPND